MEEADDLSHSHSGLCFAADCIELFHSAAKNVISLISQIDYFVISMCKRFCVKKGCLLLAALSLA